MKPITTLFIVTAVAAIVTFAIAKNSPSTSHKAIGAGSSATPSGYTVHEWGTFTSVFGSDGTMLPGLEVEEESLPPFVYAHDGMNGRLQAASAPAQMPLWLALAMTKGYRRPLHNVTVKMETPVLYFYSSEKIDAHVRVGFEGGSISQWYPARSGGEIPPDSRGVVGGVATQGAIDFGEKPYRGSIEWQITVEPRGANADFDVMKAHETATWIYPRAPQSDVVRTANGDSDTYLFYRGVGNFELPLTFRVSEDENLMIEVDELVPYLLVVEILNGNVRILSEGAVADTASVNLADSAELAPMSEMRLGIYSRLKEALVDAGLFEEEAAAMLRTWWSSYFGRDGIRAFWVVPRSFTDRILPIQLDPAPENLERVLLGRSEILTPQFESALVKAFTKALDQKRKPYNPYGLDRYAKAYEARVKALAPDLKMP